MEKDLSVEDLTQLITDSVLESRYFNQKELYPKIKVILKHYFIRKNTPANYNKIISPSKTAKLIRTSEQKNFEVNCWKRFVENECPELLQKAYTEINKQLKDRGFIK